MRISDIREGVLVRIRRSTDGVDCDLYVRELQDGKVIFARTPSGPGGGRWWLPVAHVLDHGAVIPPTLPRPPLKRGRKPGSLSERTLAILERLKAGESQASIAADLGCTHQNISHVKRAAEKRLSRTQ